MYYKTLFYLKNKQLDYFGEHSINCPFELFYLKLYHLAVGRVFAFEVPFQIMRSVRSVVAHSTQMIFLLSTIFSEVSLQRYHIFEEFSTHLTGHEN